MTNVTQANMSRYWITGEAIVQEVKADDVVRCRVITGTLFPGMEFQLTRDERTVVGGGRINDLKDAENLFDKGKRTPSPEFVTMGEHICDFILDWDGSHEEIRFGDRIYGQRMLKITPEQMAEFKRRPKR